MGGSSMKKNSRSALRNQSMNSTLSRLGISVLAALLSPELSAADLKALDVAALPGDRVELKLSFDEPVPAPRGYTIEQPARIALDLPGVANKLGTKHRELGVGNARSVTLVEANGRTRMIVNLAALSPYSTRAEGNHLYVVLGESAAAPQQARTALPPVAAATPAPPVKSYAPAGKAIQGIDFQRGAQGEGNVVIDLSSPGMNPDVQEQGGKIRLDFPGAQLPESLRARLDVKDFATPVQFVSASSQGGKASILIEPSGLFDYLVYQADNRLTVSVKPLTQENVAKRNADRFAYSGEKLSLNFQDIDVRSVLQLIADFTNLNLVASDTVQGNITLRLQNVPWDQALDLVLKTKGLDKRKVGNVLLVAPADEIAARERQELEAQQQIAELAPLRRELVQVNYAKAADIAKLFQSVTSAEEAEDQRGSITVDERTNNIIAYQTQERLDELRRIVAQLDIPVRQVMIEARIVEAVVGYDKSLGVRWGGAVTSGNTALYGLDDNGDEAGNTGDDLSANTPFVDLGAANATSGFGLAVVTDNLLLDLELSAMEKTGNGEVISQPKVLTSDKETAKILTGTEIPYSSQTSSGATDVSWKDAALSLEVTPQITPDNRIIMAVKVNKDEPDYANAAANGEPPIKKNAVNAKVLIGDGETIVIGGVFSNSQSKSVDKVPFLGDLPFIGRFFRSDTVTDSKSELLVFLTPRILNNQAIAVSR
ncbi:type IV pilus assembly protein PilQ [Azotobacter beijerinckii]|uniref:Type IV pilus assembly protein PilQ n=2 Tax=Azotobacter beijerinckii TaxID=170623 RepID=A0A1I3YC62_9GAMM|nr:type IV pilus assembly protein PilQ [Azotobacter beijerinckii]SFK29333.1 type IV pilus assembly protein PilQ [Azotobacter beijerinckii]